MPPELVGGPLNIIASAVTPAVMISAGAILIGGVSTKHSSMSDRLRLLTAEYRAGATSDLRRENIARQCQVFLRRVRYAAIAHMLLYGSVACFSLMVLAISLTPLSSGWRLTLFPLFLSGVALVLAAAWFEIMELHLGNRVLLLETAEAFRNTDG